MKILHVIEDISPASGGPSISALSMACAQAGIVDYEVGFLCYKKDGQETTLNLSKIYPNYDKVKIYNVCKNGRIESFFALKFRAKFYSIISSYDLVIIHGSWLPSLIQVGLVSNSLSKPHIVVPRGMLDPWSMAYKKWKKYPIWKLFWKKIVNTSIFIQALNSDEKVLMRKVGVTAPIEVIGNGIFSSELKKIQSLDSSEFQQKELSTIKQNNYILFLSRIHYKKGLDILIKAFFLFASQVKDINLVIAGPDEGGWVEAKNLIGKYNLEERVKYIGPVYGYDKFRLIKNSKCFCLPSRQEGFSMAIIEAMAVGACVIMSKACHFSEAVIFNAAIETSLDEGEIATAIINIVKNDEKSKQIGRNSSLLIEDKYTWESLSRKYDNVINDYFNK